jgi:hypothetical protein
MFQLYMLVFLFLDTKLEDKRFWTEWMQTSPEFSVIVTDPWKWDQQDLKKRRYTNTNNLRVANQTSPNTIHTEAEAYKSQILEVQSFSKYLKFATLAKYLILQF